MYGRQEVFRAGSPLTIFASDPKSEDMFPIGITLDWSLVAALGSDTKDPDGITYKSGTKRYRYGQVMAKLTSQPTQTLTQTATGGTFTLSGYRPDTGAYVVTSALAYDASAATVLAALTDPAVFGKSFAIAVALSTGVYTVTGNIGTLTVGGGSLTGGTLAQAAGVAVANSGYYGPYDSAASDGRQTLTRGACGILVRSVSQGNPYGGLTVWNHDNPPLAIGGLVWRERIIATTGSHSLANGPTFTELEAAFPTLKYGPSAP